MECSSRTLGFLTSRSIRRSMPLMLSQYPVHGDTMPPAFLLNITPVSIMGILNVNSCCRNETFWVCQSPGGGTKIWLDYLWWSLVRVWKAGQSSSFLERESPTISVGVRCRCVDPFCYLIIKSITNGHDAHFYTTTYSADSCGAQQLGYSMLYLGVEILNVWKTGCGVHASLPCVACASAFKCSRSPLFWVLREALGWDDTLSQQ
jgi:hypothetical protein